MAVGVGGTLWVERRVRSRMRQAVDRLHPGRLSDGVAASARQVGARFQGAIAAGRDERSRREAELWRQFGPDRPGRWVTSDAGTHTRATPRRRRARR